MQIHFDVVITKEGKNFVSWSPQLDIASCGESIEEARENLKEAIELYLEDEDARIQKSAEMITLTSIEVKTHGKAAGSVGL